MELKLLAGLLIFCCFYEWVTPQAFIENTLNDVKKKILALEDSGHIFRDYEKYYQHDFRDGENYDFIIVGAGSSGSALVRRLSEIKKWNILLLEAGGEPEVYSEIPFWSTLSHFTKLNWNYTTEQEENFALGFEDQRLRWHRGKGLGGSSLLNFMVTARGVKEDYDRWAAQGNPGWSYEEVLPYLKKLENAQIHHKDWEFRGDSGPVFIEEPYRTESGTTFVKASSNNGYHYIDYNGKTNKGTSYIQGFIKRGFRCSGELCYIRPVKNRKNLTIRLHSHVTKILIDNNVAYGIEYSHHGKIFTAFADKEVILSAGAINSPQILLLSGIGPKKQLLHVGIEPIVDLPVGESIKDHMAYFGLGFAYNQSITLDVSAATRDESFLELYRHGKGVLTSIGSIEAVTFSTTYAAPNSETDVELIFGSSFLSDDPLLSMAGLLGIDSVLYDKIYRPNVGVPSGTCVPVVMHPKSSGRLELRSSNPFDHPKLYSGYFTDPKGSDMKTMIAGIRECIRIGLSPPFHKYGVRLMEQPVLNCGKVLFDSDEYWECAIRHMTTTLFHQTNGCKMGPPQDPQAVVDNRLRVYGIEDLRVVDTSIIPVSITGHTGIPAYMVGEKAADIIKKDYLHEIRL